MGKHICTVENTPIEYWICGSDAKQGDARNRILPALRSLD